MYDISLKIGKFAFYTTSCRNENFPRGSFFFFNAQFLFYIYAIISPKIGKIYNYSSKNKLSSQMLFFKYVILLSKYSIISPKIDEICYYLSKYMNFSHGWYFLNASFLGDKYDISLKISKFALFATGCRNINFPRGWYFVNARFFYINSPLFSWNRQNSELIVN